MYVTVDEQPAQPRVTSGKPTRSFRVQPIGKSKIKKLMLKTKLVLFVLLATCIQLKAGVAQKVTYQARNVSLKEVFVQIMHKS